MTDNQKFNRINIIISIVIAFIAWIYVVYNYSPMKNVTYTSVPITYVGMDSLANRGYAIKSSTDDAVDVVVAVERKAYANTSAEDIAVVADVSAAVEGNNGISLEVDTPDGVKLKKLKKRMVSVDIAECTSKDVYVTPIYKKSIGNGTEPLAKTISYKKVSVVGIKENIDKVSYAVLKTDNYDLDDNPRAYVINPVAVDASGKVVPHVLVLPSEISVHIVLGQVKEVPLDIKVENVPEGISYKAPETIRIKGTADALKSIDKIEAEPVNLTGVNENTTVSINCLLPDGIEIAQASLGLGIEIF